MSKEEPWFRVIGTEGEIAIAADFEGGKGLMLYNAVHPDGAPPATGLLSFRSCAPLRKGSGGAAIVRAQPTEHRGFIGSFSCQWEEICGCVEAGLAQSVVSPPAEALVDVAVVEAMYRSVRSRRWEAVAVNSLTVLGARL